MLLFFLSVSFFSRKIELLHFPRVFVFSALAVYRSFHIFPSYLVNICKYRFRLLRASTNIFFARISEISKSQDNVTDWKTIHDNISLIHHHPCSFFYNKFLYQSDCHLIEFFKRIVFAWFFFQSDCDRTPRELLAEKSDPNISPLTG